MKHRLPQFFLAGVVAMAAGLSSAQPVSTVVKAEAQKLGALLDGCASQAKAVLAVRDKLPQPDKELEVEKCAADGKAALRASHDRVKASFAGHKLPNELVDWRTQWLNAFEAVVPKEREQEPAYTQRLIQAKKAIGNATMQFEAALQ